MKHPLLILAAGVVTTLVVGCGPSRAPGDVTPTAVLESPSGKAPKPTEFKPDDRVVALLSWLEDKGVSLEVTRIVENYVECRVARPQISNDYDVVFSIRSFPPDASEKVMRQALDVNLAYMLNAPAHLAMSYAGYVGNSPETQLPQTEEELPKVDGMPVTKAVEKGFREYDPSRPRAIPTPG